MKKFFKTALTGTLLMCALSVSAFAANEGGGTVNASDVNFRTEPNLESEIVTKLANGTGLVVIEKTDELWYKVWNNGSEGYVYAQYVDFSESLDFSIGEGTVSATTVSFRNGASLDADRIGSFDTDKKISVNGVSGEWYKVNIDGVDGYMHSDYVSLTTAQAPENAQDEQVSVEEIVVETPELEINTASADIIPTLSATSNSNMGQTIVDTAMNYMGVPYVWAGTSPSGFDCSGLVYYVFNQNGYKTNRTAESLAHNGVQVDRADLQAGDIITFYNSSYSYVGHVGIYIGNNQFIHASSAAGQVVIDDLTGYYSDRFHVAKRIAE